MAVFAYRMGFTTTVLVTNLEYSTRALLATAGVKTFGRHSASIETCQIDPDIVRPECNQCGQRVNSVTRVVITNPSYTDPATCDSALSVIQVIMTK